MNDTSKEESDPNGTKNREDADVKMNGMSQIKSPDPRFLEILTGDPQISEILQKKSKEIPPSNWIKHRAIITPDQSFTLLHKAAIDGQESTVKSILENKTDANVKTTGGVTPLHLSAQIGHFAITELLLSQNADILAKDNYSLTPLHYAAENGHSDVIELLIRNGANVNLSDLERFTPLHYAAKHGNVEIMEILIKNGANVNSKCAQGTTPLFGVAIFGHFKAAECLLQHKIYINLVSRIGTALQAAVQHKNKEMVRLLLKNGAKIGEALHTAIENSSRDIVEMLLSSGANANYYRVDEPPLVTAVKHRRSELVGVLVKHGAAVNYAKGLPLTLAVMMGATEIADSLLENGALVKTRHFKENCTLLHVASQKGYFEIVKILLKYGDEVDALTTSRVTPLLYAAGAGHADVVSVLLTNGADANFEGDHGSALHAAASQGHTHVVKLLLSKGIKMSAKDRCKKTALEYAVLSGNTSVVSVFVHFKRNSLKERNSDGLTMLHIATNLACVKKDRTFEMVKFLVSKGACMNTLSQGLKPIHVAAKSGPVELVQFFISHGQRVNELCGNLRTPLHYATTDPNRKVVDYLVRNGGDINAMDPNGVRPLHVAASVGEKELAKLFLSMGAIYHPAEFNTDEFNEHQDVKDMLVGTAMLFFATEINYVPGLIESIKKGAFLDAKNPAGETPLIVAAYCRHQKVTAVLLQNGANPNISDSNGMTPLHYAVRESKIKIVSLLLAHGAVFEARTAVGSPMAYATNEEIMILLKLVGLIFKNVRENNISIVDDLKVIQDTDSLRAILGARNWRMDTVYSLANKIKFQRFAELKELLVDADVVAILRQSSQLIKENKLSDALALCRSSLAEKRTQLPKYGPYDERGLAIKEEMVKIAHKMNDNDLGVLADLNQKLKDVFGSSETSLLDSK